MSKIPFLISFNGFDFYVIYMILRNIVFQIHDSIFFFHALNILLCSISLRFGALCVVFMEVNARHNWKPFYAA
jgi:hypothetical protein